MKKYPLISVIIPVYNGEKYLAEAIESVLLQDYVPIEIIVIDDGSTDGSSVVAKQYREVHYHFQPHSGVATALNAGIGKASGDYLAFLDADDIWVKDKLSIQMAAFRKDPDLDIVFGYIEEFYDPTEITDQAEKNYAISRVIPGYSKCGLLIRKASFFRVGLFDTRWVIGDFIDWYKRAMEIGIRSLMLPEIVSKRRIHTDNIGIRERDSQKDYVHILKAALDRQRLKKAEMEAQNMEVEDSQEPQ